MVGAGERGCDSEDDDKNGSNWKLNYDRIEGEEK